MASEIEGIDPLTAGKTMYAEEDIKGSSTFGQMSAPASIYTAPVVSAATISNRSEAEQDKVAAGRKEKVVE